MNAYNPLDSMKRLEAAGLDRRQAEAIASEINDSAAELVTKVYLREQLDSLERRLDTKLDLGLTKMDAALSRQLVRIGVLFTALLTLACSVIGVLISLK
ncbi:hypothetical protein AB5I41_05090 [Sphingomonas sp. MMS24-JH45]